MTSLTHKTRRSPFQQVCKCFPTQSSIDFPNCVLNFFFLKLCSTSRSILIDNIFEITPKKKAQRTQLWSMWQTLAKFVPKKFCQKEYRVLRHVRSRIILLKNCIVFILMQSTINYWIIPWYTSMIRNCYLKKKLVSLHVCNSWRTKH